MPKKFNEMKPDNKRLLKLYDVSRAIEEGRVALCFQPIIRARDHRFPMFYEGLIRIFDGDGDLRHAGEFINVVEGTEVGSSIDQIALELALHKLAGNKATRISINMSTRTLWDRDWMYLLRSAGERDRSVTERLIVEFTESSVMQSIIQTKSFMDFCRQFGVCFACDDFGAGQTVIGHLREFNFDIIKIDGRICQDVAVNEDSQVLMRAILSIASYFDMVTVAEFIDNMPAAEKCRELGIDGLQGFLFNKGELYNPYHPELVERALSGTI